MTIADMLPPFVSVDRPADRAVYRYLSPALGDGLEITVVPPLAMAGPRAPVLYVLDPLLTLDTVVGWSRVYGRYSEGAIPHCFVVGIGFPPSDESTFHARRARDYTPTARTGSRNWQPRLGAGHGPQLLAAIADEVIPFVEGRYPASPEGRTLIGWSLSGLFTLTTLLARPEVFFRYLAVGPSLWWDDRLMMGLEAAYAAAHDDLAARVFMAVGAREEAPGGGWLSEGFPDDVIAWFSQVSNFRAFTRRLKSRRYPSLSFDSVVFRDEYHMSVYPAAVARGLVRLFEG